MSRRDVSIITVNYNGLEHTCQMIDSLVDIEGMDYQLIVVDNGSIVNEANAIKELYPWVDVVRSEQNLGFAGGNNLGIQKAEGNYILLLNNDTIVREPLLEIMMDTFSEYSNVGVVSPKILFEYSDRVIQYAGFTDMSRVTLRNHAVGYGEPDSGKYDKPEMTFYAHGAAMMLSREVIDRVGMMPECYFLYYEELDWCEMIRRNGYKIAYQPKAEVFHKESMATSKITGLKAYYQVRNRLFYARRNRKSPARELSELYQLCIVLPKLLIKGDWRCVGKMLKGAMDGVFSKCWMLLIVLLLVLSGCEHSKYEHMLSKTMAYARDSIKLERIPEDITGEFEVRLVIPTKCNITTDSIVVPSLKYNKKFAYSFTGDDTYASIYRKALMISLGRNILKLDKDHYVSSDQSEHNIMGYCDPFGRTHCFKLGIAVQVFHKSGLVTPYFSRMGTFSREYITWDELDAFKDFGCGIYNHGGGLLPETFGPTSFTLNSGQNIFEDRLGYRPKIMIRPDGNDEYIAAAWSMPEFVMCTTEGTCNNLYPEPIDLSSPSLNLTNMTQMRTCLDGMSIDGMITRIDSLVSQNDSGKEVWIHDFVHTIGEDGHQSVHTSLLVAYFTYLNNRFGVDGDNSIWFASMDEVYEYWWLKQSLSFEVDNSGEETIVYIRGYMPKNFNWKELSFCIKMPSSCDVAVHGIECEGVNEWLTEYDENTRTMSIWMDMSKDAVYRASKHLMFLERYYTEYHLRNALYFMDALPEDLVQPFRNRLDLIKTRNQNRDKQWD